MPLDLWSRAHLYPKIAQIVQKLIILFIENWKEIGPWSWLIWITWWLLFISIIFRGWTGVKFDQILKLWVSPVTAKIWVLQNALNDISTTYEDYLWPKFQLNQTLLTGVIAQKIPKMGPEAKRRSGLFLVKSEMANTQKLKLDIQTA